MANGDGRSNGRRGRPPGPPGGGRRHGGTDPAEVLARAADRLSEKLEAKAAHLDRHAAQIAEQAAKLDKASDRLATVDLWMRGLGGARKPRFTHDDVRAAAIRIADAEGLDALSMRRLASELQAPTMTLYYYVRTKDELLSLLHDAVMAEVVFPSDEVFADDWKEAMTHVAGRTRDVLARHPWVTNIGEGPSVGPASVRHFEQSLQALAGLDQPFAVKLDILNAVDEYVFGYCGQLADEPRWPELTDLSEYVTTLMADGTFPQLQAAVDELTIDGVWRETERLFNDPDRFVRNVRRLLDGIERSLAG
jgi:AcrR family transcriptional regulator